MAFELAHNWWTLVIRGIFALLFGAMAFAWPGITLGVLVILYGAYAMADGVFAIAAALGGGIQGMPWWSFLVEGLVGISVGLMTFFWPGITALVLLYLIAAWALITGILEIVEAVRLRNEVQGEWLLALTGFLSIVFALALVANPGAGAMAVVWLIGAYAITFGVLLIALGVRLRSMSRLVSPTSHGW